MLGLSPKITSKSRKMNYLIFFSLRTVGDNDRALGIELLIEELFKRNTIMSETNINMITFVGVKTPLKLTKHA